MFGLILPQVVHADDTRELKLGYYVDGIMISTQSLLLDEDLNARVAAIAHRIAKASDHPDKEFTCRVLNDPNINAFSVAGGFIYINTGLLDVLESEDELASVISHEIAHVNESHQVKFATRALRAEMVGMALNIFELFLNAFGSGVTNAYVSMHPQLVPYMNTFNSLQGVGVLPGEKVGEIGYTVSVNMIEGYAKDQELEADSLAIQYVKKAGYDPNALVKFFKRLISIRDRLKINERNYISSLINAKPGLAERIEHAEALLPDNERNKVKN